MSAAVPGPAGPDMLAAALAPDLVAIIGDLVAEAPGPAGPAPVPVPAGPGPVVKVRLSGEPAGIAAVLAVLARAGEVLDRSGPRPNRYDPGERVYLTIRTGPA